MSRPVFFLPWPALVVVCLLLSMVACGGSSSSSGGSGGTSAPPPTIAISISPTSATISAGGTQQFQATVTGSSNTSVQWKVNNVVGGSPQNGTISATGLYTAPTSDVSLQVTVTAVANADPTKTANATVTVNPVPPPPPPPVITVTISPTSATMAVSTTQQFTATVTGTSNTSVTWSVDGVNGGKHDCRHRQHEWPLHRAFDGGHAHGDRHQRGRRHAERERQRHRDPV